MVQEAFACSHTAQHGASYISSVSFLHCWCLYSACLRVFMCVLSQLFSQMGWHLVYDENKMDEYGRGWTTAASEREREIEREHVCVAIHLFLCSFVPLCVYAPPPVCARVRRREPRVPVCVLV